MPDTITPFARLSGQNTAWMYIIRLAMAKPSGLRSNILNIRPASSAISTPATVPIMRASRLSFAAVSLASSCLPSPILAPISMREASPTLNMHIRKRFITVMEAENAANCSVPMCP